jgi:hypothetical protein
MFCPALKDPDTLSRVRVEPDEAEWECYPAMDAYMEATGIDDHDAFHEAYEEAFGRPAGHASDDPDVEPKGKRWDFDDDDEMQKRYPKLYKKFGAS